MARNYFAAIRRKRNIGLVRIVVLGCALGASIAVGGCGGNASVLGTARPMRGEGAPVVYSYPMPDGGSVGARDLLGRDTVLLFLTTYDALSLAVARRLTELWHTRTPRFNALLVALEPPQNAPLVAVFRDSIANGIPVVLADQDTLNGSGGFGDLRAVPGVVLLDRDGRVVYRGFGAEAYRYVEDRLRETAAP